MRLKRMVLALAAASMVGAGVPVAAQHGHDQGQKKAAEQAKKEDREKAKPHPQAAKHQPQARSQQERRQVQHQQKQAQHQQKQQHAQQQRQARQREQLAQQQAQRTQRQEQQKLHQIQQQQQRQAQQRERLAQQQAQRAQRQQQQKAQQIQHERKQHMQPAPPPARSVQKIPRADVKHARLSADSQQQLINAQRQRLGAYRQRLQQQETLLEQRAATLQRANRLAAYRAQQLYLQRLRQQRIAVVNNYSSYNYASDPFFYTPPSYRYYRAGTSYAVNDYAANLLREAINYGYQEGFAAGQADRQDGYRFNYQASYAYQDANYGYTGFYVNQSEYNHYFREGFRRGYEDGYYSRQQYGTSSSGKLGILGTVLSAILQLVPIG